jgi:hypothetical protein
MLPFIYWMLRGGEYFRERFLLSQLLKRRFKEAFFE